jgi:hypothetical protein
MAHLLSQIKMKTLWMSLNVFCNSILQQSSFMSIQVKIVGNTHRTLILTARSPFTIIYFCDHTCKCVIIWDLRLFFWLNPFPQCRQTNGFSPVWVRRCLWSLEWYKNSFPQNIHSCFPLKSPSEAGPVPGLYLSGVPVLYMSVTAVSKRIEKIFFVRLNPVQKNYLYSFTYWGYNTFHTLSI